MPKSHYDVAYKTYYNERIKPVEFRGKESHPLYVQVTYDRRTIFFKSYYFELFRQKKYDLQRITIDQIDQFESQVIDFIIDRNTDKLDLDLLLYEYKLFSADILDTFEKPFLEWLAGCLRVERLPALAAVIEEGTEKFLAIQLWDDMKVSLPPDIISRIDENAIREPQPYYLLAAYIRDKYPKGPFCLPLHEWFIEKDHIPINEIASWDFLERTFERENIRVNVLDLARVIHRMMFRDVGRRYGK